MRLKSATLKDVMSRAVVVVPPDASLVECARQMRAGHVGCVVVVAPGDGPRRPLGLVTDRDLVVEAIAVGLDPAALTAGDVMSRPAATARADEDMLDALARMRENGVRRLPVLDAGGGLAGIVAVDDLLEGLVELTGALAGVLRAERTRETSTRS